MSIRKRGESRALITSVNSCNGKSCWCKCLPPTPDTLVKAENT